MKKSFLILREFLKNHFRNIFEEGQIKTKLCLEAPPFWHKDGWEINKFAQDK